MGTDTRASNPTLSLGSVESELQTAALREWTSYVVLAKNTNDDELSSYAEILSTKLRVGKDSIYRRLAAIRHGLASGQSVEDIVARGQEITLSEWMLSKKKEKTEKETPLGYRLPGSLKSTFDEQMERVKSEAGLVTTIQFFDWLVAHLRDVSAEEIKHDSGAVE